MKRVGMPVVIAVACTVGVAGQPQWPQWRGPALNGVVPGDAPTTWNDSSRVSWKVGIPGRGFSSPVVSGDRLFLTTAVPTGKGSPRGSR